MDEALLGLCALLVLSLAASTGTLAYLLIKANEDWADERRELINRIQHPQRVPVKAVPPRHPDREMSDETVKAYARIGTAQPYRPDDAA